MLPLQQAREVTQSIREYIRATFAFSNEKTERAFYDFIKHPDRGMIKGLAEENDDYRNLKEKSGDIEPRSEALEGNIFGESCTLP